MSNPPRKKIVRFLSLGSFQTDRRLKNFISLFRENGFSIELFFASQDTSQPNIDLKDITLREIKLSHFRGRKMFSQYDTLLKKELDNAEPCDILFSTELYSLKAASESKQQGYTKQLFYDARELYTELPAVSAHPFKKFFWKRWERKGLQQTDLVIVTAPEDSEAIRKIYGFLPPSILIRNFPRTEPLTRNNYLREHFRIPSAKKIFVYAGGLLQDRGLEKMTDAMTVFKDSSVFVMIGEGLIKESLEKHARELNLEYTIFFLPSINSDKLLPILSSADAGISLIETHSKSYELALPSKVFEYMLAGLPVISSPLRQVKELLGSHTGIFYADPDNQNEIVSACEAALKESADESFRNTLHEDAVKEFTFEKESNALLKFLE